MLLLVTYCANFRLATCRPAQSVHENETQVLREQNWHLGLGIPSPRCLLRFRETDWAGRCFFYKTKRVCLFRFRSREQTGPALSVKYYSKIFRLS